MNKVILSGRLTRDPEVRQNTEVKVARFTLAVDRYKSDADFINCIAFGKNADFAENYLRKGVKYIVVGNWKTGNYTNKDGIKVYTNELQVESYDFCENKGDSSEQREQGFAPNDVPENIELPFD